MATSRESGLKFGASALSQLLGPWMHGKGPLRLRLKRAVENAILDGLIVEGTRLPSERKFAEAGGVSRSTIVSAYETLVDDGLLERRRGSGTIVRASGSRVRMTARRDAALSALSSGTILQESDEIIDLSVGWPDLPNEFLPYLEGLSFAELHESRFRSVYAPLGLASLRELLAQRYCDDGIPTTADNVMITTGSQQALSLAASLLVRSGEPVAIEQPTFFVALDAFRTLGARLCAFSPGFADRSLSEKLGTGSFRALYCIPTFHNPTGHVMSESARRSLVAAASEHNVPILEDCALETLGFEGSTPKSLAYYDPDNVITAGSLSKLFWPGLRLGWVRASKSTIARLGRLKVMSDLGTPVPSQILAQRVLASFDRIAAFRRHQLHANCEFLSRALAQQLPHWTFTKPSGGLCLWVRLPLGDSATFAQFAAREGVRVLPGSSMTVDGSCPEYLRVPFTMGPEIIETGVQRLAAAWNRYEQARYRGADSLTVVV